MKNILLFIMLLGCYWLQAQTINLDPPVSQALKCDTAKYALASPGGGGSTDTTSLSHRIDLKLAIVDTTNKWQAKGSYLKTESDPIWIADSNLFYKKTWSDSKYQQKGSYISAESDPIWKSDSSTYQRWSDTTANGKSATKYYVDSNNSLDAKKSTSISTGNGLSGGGNLSTSRTLLLDTTLAQTRNRSLVQTTDTAKALRIKINERALKSTTLSNGYGINSIGDLSTNRTVSVDTANIVSKSHLQSNYKKIGKDTNYVKSIGDTIYGNLAIRGDINFKSRHGYMYFSGQSVTIIATQNIWYRVTNATKNLFTVSEADFITIRGDSIIINYAGSYLITGTLTFSGGNDVEQAVRLYKNGNAIGAYIGMVGKGAGREITIPFVFYSEDSAVNDKLELRTSNLDDNSDPVLIGGTLFIQKLYGGF